MSENPRNEGSVDTSSRDGPSNSDLNAGDDDHEADETQGLPECAVCLQPCIHPVRLPCSHMFCYLCMKGVAGHSRRCALCRAEIPQDFVRRPVLVSPPHKTNSREPDKNAEIKYHWYYEGVGGWWEYDERTSNELEARLQERQSEGSNQSTTFDILIAGFIYVIDLENNFQYRREYPRRRRKIKRDCSNLPDCKGVAGLKRVKKQTPCERRGGDGGESSGAAAAASVPLGTAAINGLASVSIDPSVRVVSSDPRRSSNPSDNPSVNASRDAHSRHQAGADRVDADDDVTRQMRNLSVRDGIRQRHVFDAAADNRLSQNGDDRGSNSRN